MSNTEKRFLSLSDLAKMPPPKWAIEGLFEVGTLTMLAGPSYSFKSFLLLDWLLCMAVGRKWNGRATVQCKVAYALGEGKSSLLKRIHAWVYHNDLDERETLLLEDNFKITFDVPQLALKASVDNMLAELVKENFQPEIIAIDTFARSMVGKDENDAKDTGEWIDQADRLRQLGYGVIFLHHTKKNTDPKFGGSIQYRGSTAIIGAMDTAMALVRDKDFCTLTVTKQKDHDEGAPMRFKRLMVNVGNDDDSCVLTEAPLMDERFAPPVSERPPRIEDLVAELWADTSYTGMRDRARALSTMSGLSEAAAYSRIARARADSFGVMHESDESENESGLSDLESIG